MTERNLTIATAVLILFLFAIAFDFSGVYWKQIALIACGGLLGNLLTVADYVGE
jgi:hypothetical protein